MSLTKVTRNFQVTIPSDIRRAFHIGIGTIIDFSVEKGNLVVRPKTLVDEEQAWFWTEEWQKGEQEVTEAKKKGQIKTFNSVQKMRECFEK